MSEDRLDACRARLDAAEDAPLDERADALEQVHRTLVAELDALLDSDRTG